MLWRYITHVVERVSVEGGASTPFVSLGMMASVRFAIPTGVAKQMKRMLKRL
jgi:hypothetical protein